MKKIYWITVVCALSAMLPQALMAQFRIVGYIRSYGNMVADLQKIDLDRITHLNIAFINPDTTGRFRDWPSLDSVVNIAHARNIKVLMSCGGGSRQAYYGKLLADPYRAAVVNNFIAFVDRYNLDGVDVDIEGDDIDHNYENFVVALRVPLSSRNKLLTAAVAYYTRQKITDVALAQFDFINMMAYDKTGPWRPANAGQHSPVSYAKDHLRYWSKERGVRKEKLVLGVPFYGYGFGQLPDSNRFYREMGYGDIIAAFPGAEERDEVILPGKGGMVYFNGMPTIREKTQLAMREGSGIMIWQLLHDTGDDHSLLKVVYETSQKKNKKSKTRAEK